jgi:hypothetical protein
MRLCTIYAVALLVSVSCIMSATGTTGTVTALQSKSKPVKGTKPACAVPIVQHLIDTYIPRLKDYKIEVVEWKTNGPYFLKSAPKLTSVIYSGKKRTYQVYVNPFVCGSSGPPKHALEAILAHELMHTVSYTKMSTIRLGIFVTRYGTSASYLQRYEHQTDKDTLELGTDAPLAQGLKAYREWVYDQIKSDPENLAAKKREYMTPQQIDQYVRDHIHKRTHDEQK